ncbi:hypothetical protein JCM3765_007563 [Sporobolomyces pararoseus]
MAPSLWRKPGTKTFQLVHRSQRDPLINDPEASDRVLKEISKPQRGGQSFNAYEQSFVDSEGVEPKQVEESPFGGDASSYGIFFDDQEYDYLQHLRSVGDRPDAHLVEAPTPKERQQRKRGKGKEDELVGFKERDKFVLPEDSLPSHPLDEVSYSNYHQQRQENESKGLQPDLDPRIREVLEALDDDAYAVDDGEGTDGEDEFWGGVLKGGEGNGDEWEQEEDYDEEEQEVERVGEGIENLILANGKQVQVSTGGGEWDAVKRFKAAAAAQNGSDDEEDEFESEMGDTIAELVKSSARRPPRGGLPRGGGSVAGSSFSMSSSAMFRNEGLRTLDDRFDQIEKMYDESDDDSWGGGGGGGSDEDESEIGGEFHGPQREDLEQIMDEFLSRYEVIGGKMRQQLKPLVSEDPNSLEYEGLDPEEATRRANASKLDRIRASLANLDLEGGESDEVEQRKREKERILKIVERQEREEERRIRKGLGRETPKVDILEDRRRDRWDCETVLSTYSNLSNHPRLLRIRDNKLKTPKPAQIKLDPKTGFPLVNGQLVTGKDDTIMEENEQDGEQDEEEEEEEMEEYIPKETIKRPRGETAEEKKARKQQVKNERQSRRSEKKQTKESFENEVKRQKKVSGKRVAEGAAADIRPGKEGVRRLA